MDNIKLDEIDPDDFTDSLLKLEKSFGAKFGNTSFKDAKTFGDICDAIKSQIDFIDSNDCTTQQAFYKIRKAINLTQANNGIAISPQSKLEDIFPRSNRRQKVKEFQQALGIPVNFLAMKGWLSGAIFIGYILLLVGCFFNLKIAIIGLTLLTMITWIANGFSKELDVSTVRQLTEKIAREHYSQARRHIGTVNKNEIAKTIQDVFIADYDIRREDLTRDTSLG